MISLITTFGTMALVGGSIGYLFFPLGLTAGIKAVINLAENGFVFPIYMNPPFAAKSEFHLFAITNPRQVLQGGKMSLQVKGPYRFDTYLHRDNIVFSEQGDRVKFNSSRRMAPNEAQSASFDEKMWLFNPILPSAQKTVRFMIVDRVPFQRFSEPIVFNVVNALLDNYKERLILRSTPRELLIGRKVELLESLTGMANRFGLSALLPPSPPQNIFGLTFLQNETINEIELWTGVGRSRDKFAEVAKWRGKNRLDIWRDKCNTIEGTNGELFKPLLEQGRPISIFLSPLCRSLLLEPVGNDTVVLPELGLRTLDYEFSPSIYWGARKNPGKECYCENVRSYECQYDGLISVAPCFFESPVYMSQSNLKGVDKRIQQSIDFDSLNSSSLQLPDLQRFSIEPITGTVLRVNLTLLAMVKMIKQPFMRDLARVQNLTYVPLFSTTEAVAVPFRCVWQIYLLQKFNDYHKPIMAGISAGGLGMLIMKFLYF